jgi:peptide/nickel transport system permease protein
MRWQIITIASIFAMSILGASLAPYDPMLTDAVSQMQSPNLAHILGTDTLGRDVLSRLLYGSQRTLIVTILATLIAVGLGICIAILATFFYNIFQRAAVTFITALIAFPNLLLALVVLTLLGRGMVPLTLATGLAQIAPMASVLRLALLRVRAMPYIESGITIGASQWHILRFYVLPNVRSVILAYTGITFSYCLFNSAGLSFLGLGGEPGIPDWGIMLADGRNAFRSAPWISLAPGILITLMIWAVNSLADTIGSANSVNDYRHE